MKVTFRAQVEDSLLKYAVIVTQYNNQWVFCKHKQRNSYEIPGGHRELDETILSCAKRELYEETGAEEFDIQPMCVYCVEQQEQQKSYGMLYFAQVYGFGKLPDFEMETVRFFSELPKLWTYPQIQPFLLQEVQRRIGYITEKKESYDSNLESM